MNIQEYMVAKTDELKNGEMKIVIAGGEEILLCKNNDEYFALSAYCTHYGANLSGGVLSGDRIVCPLHHACFSVRNGDVLEPPAQDPLLKYEVKIKGEEVIIFPAGKNDKENIKGKRITVLNHDVRIFAVIGGGASGNTAVQTLRHDGFNGKIILITQENKLPYDRPNLSKEYLSGEAEASWMPLRSSEFYNENDVEVLINKKVKVLEVKSKQIKFTDGENMKYDKVLVATGCRPRKLNLAGETLKNIFVLRSFDDADMIIEASKNASKAVIIGASFIGLEAAYSLSKRKIPVTIISQEYVPFKRVFGKEIGKLIKNLHEENGVSFRLSRTLKSFEGKKKVESVSLENGDIIEADLVIMGIGVEPSTEFVKGVQLLPDGSLKVDNYFRFAEDSYAAGDIATVHDWRTNENVRIEHWRTAQQGGRNAAHNMAGREIPYTSIPFFWTSQVGINLRYVGHAKEWQEIIIHGEIAARDFIAFYIKDGLVYSAAGCNRDKEIAAIEELMRLNKMPSASQLRYDSTDFFELLRK